MDPDRIVGLLAEPDRLRVVAALALGASTLDDIAATAGLEPREATGALVRLEQGGLVATDGTSYVLLGEAFKMAARSRPAPSEERYPEAADAAEERILQTAFAEGRLTALPAKRSKRLVVLDHLAQRFEPGRRYSERQVNATLAPVHDDTATLRRYLVDEGFLDRAGGEYWRSGGTVRPR